MDAEERRETQALNALFTSDSYIQKQYYYVFFLRVSSYYCKCDQRLEKKPCLIVKETVMYFQLFFLHNGVRRFDEPYSKPTKTVMSY